MQLVKNTLLSFAPIKFYYNEYGLFYEGQELENFDYKGNYIQNVVINKFIIHYNRNTKEPYMCFNFSRVGYKQSYTFECEGRLGITYKKIENSIDKI